MTLSTFSIIGGLAVLVTGITLFSIGHDLNSARRTYLRKLATDMEAIEQLIRKLDKSTYSTLTPPTTSITTSITTATTTAAAFSTNAASITSKDETCNNNNNGNMINKTTNSNASVFGGHSLKLTDVDPRLSIYYDVDPIVFKENLRRVHKEMREDWKSLAVLEMKLAFKAPTADTQIVTTTMSASVQNA